MICDVLKLVTTINNSRTHNWKKTVFKCVTRDNKSVTRAATESVIMCPCVHDLWCQAVQSPLILYPVLHHSIVQWLYSRGVRQLNEPRLSQVGTSLWNHVLLTCTFQHPLAPTEVFNPLCAWLISRNVNLYMYFMSFFSTRIRHGCLHLTSVCLT